MFLLQFRMISLIFLGLFISDGYDRSPFLQLLIHNAAASAAVMMGALPAAHTAAGPHNFPNGDAYGAR